MGPFVRRLWLAFAVCGVLLGAAAQSATAAAETPSAPLPPPADAPVEYARDILPILSDACYHCHGPDERGRKAKLRLDMEAGPNGEFRVKDDVAVIVPGKSGESELIRRILSDDPDEVMPPDDGVRKLTPAQKQLLKRWVDQGAKWGQLWSLVPPVRHDPPATKTTGWDRTPIDRFVLARMEKEGLKPAPEAVKGILLRRVTLDLTGLPPTPKELDDFLADNSPEAYEKVVDRLLASPRYGERMAADWLDLARYADTHGYQMDRYRATWPYRDWVIKAFNENLPFDRFATWQVAGDLLPNATKEQRLATAFNRMHMQNEEGGIVEEEFRVAYVADRVNTMGTAFLGMTFECARCHDHKYDPVSQKDVYQLFAFFQNIDESGQTTYFTDSVPVPTLLLSTPEQDAKLAELARKITEKERELAGLWEPSQADFRRWLKEKGARPDVLPGLVASYGFDDLGNALVVNAVDPAKPGEPVEGPAAAAGKVGGGAALSGDNGFEFPGIGHFSRADPLTLALWVKTPDHAQRYVVVHHSKAPIDAGSRGYELLLETGHVAFGLHHMWPGNSLKVVTKDAISVGQWTHLAVTYDGSSRAGGVRVYVNGNQRELDVVRDGLTKDITYGGGEPDLAIGYRFRDSGFKGGAVDEFQVYSRALTPLEISRIGGDRDDVRDHFDTLWRAASPELLGPKHDADVEAIWAYFVANAYPHARELERQLHALRVEQAKFVNPIPEIMVMEELPTPKPAFVLKRGAYDAPGDPVTADTPHALPPFPADQPRNRLGLARWMFDPANPLTARVTVNRLWQQMFGRGIVETADNFGSQGAQPTHPELLDYLARTYADDLHWDTKRLLKLIAMSAAYRQSSRAPAELLARDRDNVLLARGPSRRLTAEMLRDGALSVSGLLVEKLGGPSVKPYQPDGLWDVAMGRPKYDQSHGPDLYRRSLYTFWKRTVPPPAMAAFDAADRSYCTARRQSTSTPLQALALLNDVQIVEAARFVSQRMLKEGGATVDEQLAWAFRLLTGRPPTDRERPVLRRLWDEQRAIFTADKAAAGKLLAVGEAKADPSLDPVNVAAGTVYVQAILNNDSAVMRR